MNFPVTSLTTAALARGIARPAKSCVHSRGRKIDVPRGGKMDWSVVREKIAKHGMRNSNVLAIAPTATISNIMGTTPCIEPNYKRKRDFEYIIDDAARRQKWIDQSQSVNLFLATPDFKTLSHMYRRAWDKGLKTTYYLRTLQASNIEKTTIAMNKDQRGVMATQTAATAAASKKEPVLRSLGEVGYTAAEKNACSLQARQNGEECEACQ